MVMSGQYNIVNCGENTYRVASLLHKLYSSLLPVIQDVESTNPSAAYNAFFKDPSYAPFVSTLFKNVTTGVPMTAPGLYSFNGAVSFMCVTAPDQFTFNLNGPQDAYTTCVDNPNTKASYIGFIPPKPYAILCPSFFANDIAAFPRPNTCLTFNRHLNRFNGNGQLFWAYQMWIVLSMITHYYLYTSTGVFAFTDKTDVNLCLRLDAKQSSVNANNYVFYAASIFGQCRDFPSPPDDGRDLLEVDTVETPDSGHGFAGLAPVMYNATDLDLGVKDTTGSP